MGACAAGTSAPAWISVLPAKSLPVTFEFPPTKTLSGVNTVPTVEEASTRTSPDLLAIPANFPSPVLSTVPEPRTMPSLAEIARSSPLTPEGRSMVTSHACPRTHAPVTACVLELRISPFSVLHAAVTTPNRARLKALPGTANRQLLRIMVVPWFNVSTGKRRSSTSRLAKRHTTTSSVNPHEEITINSTSASRPVLD